MTENTDAINERLHHLEIEVKTIDEKLDYIKEDIDKIQDSIYEINKSLDDFYKNDLIETIIKDLGYYQSLSGKWMK